MKIADAQPGILQLPNVERGAQAQAHGAQVAQQAFAQQLERMGALRPGQVQSAAHSGESQPTGIRPDERGERDHRKPASRPRRTRAAVTSGSDSSPAAVRLDIRI